METINQQLRSWQKQPFIIQLRKVFPKAEIFLVGGAVRDALLKRETQDFDFVVRNINKKDLEKFLKKHGSVNLVGKKFGVFKFKPKNWSDLEIDIALPRTEHSLNMAGIYKDFKISSNAKLKIKDDLSRRDFTINAIAYNLLTAEIIDPFFGVKDLNNKIVRTVGNAKIRFTEDYSRILRAIRFATNLDFKIEPKTKVEIKKRVSSLNKKNGNKFIVAREIVASELVKTLQVNPELGLKNLEKYNILKTLMPEVLKMKTCRQPRKFHSEGDVYKHTLLVFKSLKSSKFKKEFKNTKISSELIWAILFHDIGKPYTITKTDRIRFNNHDNVSAKIFLEVANRLKLSSAGINVEKIKLLIAKHMLPAHIKKGQMKKTTLEKYFFSDNFPGTELLMLIFADISATVPATGKPNFSDYNSLKKQINSLKRLKKTKKQLPKPLIDGNDLIKKYNLKSSPKIGKLLNYLRESQLSGKIKTKKQGFDFIKKYL